MICPKCGNEMNGNVCENCGNNKQINFNKFIKKDDNKSVIIIFASVIIFFFILGYSFRYLKDLETKDIIKIGNEKIPSVYKVIGKKNIVNVISSSTNYFIYYNTFDFTDDDLYNYVQSLLDINFVESEVDDGMQFVKEIGNNKVLIVEIKSQDSSLCFSYYEKLGSLSDYNLTGNINVGNKDVGYISIPGNFFLSFDDHGVLIYTNSDYRSENIKLSYINGSVDVDNYKTALTAELKKKGANYNLSKTKIYGNDGYVVEQIYSTKYVTTYFFKDVLDKLYTIEITSPNKRSDLFNSIYTYRLENVEN